MKFRVRETYVGLVSLNIGPITHSVPVQAGERPSPILQISFGSAFNVRLGWKADASGAPAASTLQQTLTHEFLSRLSHHVETLLFARSAELIGVPVMLPTGLVLFSGTATLVYLVVAAVIVWRDGHRLIALALPITSLATGSAVFMTPYPSNLNIVFNVVRVVSFAIYFYAAWLIFVSDGKRMATR